MKYGIGIVVIALLAVISIIVLSGPKNAPNKSGSKTTQSEIVVAAKYDLSDTAKISWERQGKVVGNDLRRTVKVTITKNTRTFDLFDGYNNLVEHHEEFASNQAAFSVFLRAADGLGFGKQIGGRIADERGFCPLGNVFVYELKDGNKTILRSWADSCTTSEGSFGGRADSMQRLFRNQITGYDKLVSGVRF